MGKGLGAVYSPQEEETAPNGLPLDLSIFNEAGYLCIRHKGINGCMIKLPILLWPLGKPFSGFADECLAGRLIIFVCYETEEDFPCFRVFRDIFYCFFMASYYIVRLFFQVIAIAIPTVIA